MAKKKILTVQGQELTLLNRAEQEDYISLTDIAKGFDGEAGEYIRNWLRNASTVQYLGVWEKVHNPNFNLVEFHQIKAELADNRFLMSVKKWIKRTNAIGIEAKAGRYGGTYAHNEIALHFSTWLSPEFHVYLVKEFKRLKKIEAEEQQEALGWNVRRIISKANYRLHTTAIKDYLVPKRIGLNKRLSKQKNGIVYGSEADILNVALFGITAREWRLDNSDKKGNMRDYATNEQLLVLSNLESHNAEFIKEGLSQVQRLKKLNEIAIYQMQVLIDVPSMRQLKDDKPKGYLF